SIVYSIVILPLIGVLAVVLAAIVVGIPLIPVLGLMVLVFPIPGYLATGALLGGSMMGRSATLNVAEGGLPDAGTSHQPPGLGRAFLLGHILISSPVFVGLLLALAGAGSWGSNLFFLLALAVINLSIAFGWGAFLLSRFGRRAPEMVG
ncbi:MAG: hypothetical protein GY778_18350, partial [bacterium]|nr:hypothetical protein [bacterium]